jgi:hypothetical protein
VGKRGDLINNEIKEVAKEVLIVAIRQNIGRQYYFT